MKRAPSAAIAATIMSLLMACSDDSGGGSGNGGTTGGPQGAAGTQGGAGAQGAAGVGGSSGIAGTTGTAGAAGATGIAGSAGGTAGAAGTGGGSAGTTGAAGNDGGITGNAGSTGHAGSTGAAGNDGGVAGSAGIGGGGGQAGSGGLGGLDAGAGRGGSAGGAAGASGGTTGAAGADGGAAYDPCPTNGDPCRILPLGDSITFGLGGESNGNGGYRIDLFSRAVMAGKSITFTGSQMNGPTTVASMPFPRRHEGWSGYTIEQIAGRVPNPGLDPIPHIVLLHAGTNDMYMQGLPAGAPQRLGALIDELTTAAPEALIVVAKIIPFPGASSAVTTYNNAIPGLVQQRAAAGKHVVLVDQFTGFPTSELGDGVHPNAAGYRRMAGVWYAAIGDLLR